MCMPSHLDTSTLPSHAYYYDHSTNGFRFLFYDSYDIGLLGRRAVGLLVWSLDDLTQLQDDPTHQLAVRMLRANNSNADYNDPTGLHDLDRRCPWHV